MAIVAYVSGHGFGHAAREVEILRRIPAEIPLVVQSLSPEWFWRQEVARPFTFLSTTWDVGCVQSDSLTVDNAATKAAWREQAGENVGREARELSRWREWGARVIVSDVASFPLALARKAGLPGVLIANFTWADIYAEYDGFSQIVAQLQDEYGQAHLLLEAGLALPMAYLPRRESIGMVARVGTAQRERLEASLPDAARGKRLALLYVGNWGLPVPWRGLEAFSGWHFVCLSALSESVRNVTTLAPTRFWHPDLVASVDAVVSKPGYGLVGECLAAGTPLVYCPRPEFAEYPALAAALTASGQGVALPVEAFLAGAWETALERVAASGRGSRLPAPGGEAAARILDGLWRA